MPNLTDMNIQQLQSATKAEIVGNIANYLRANFSKRDLIRLLREKETDTETTETYLADGQISQRIEVERDVETGAQVSKKVTTWSYYKSGEVNVIKIEFFDAADALKRTKRIKHFRDGKQPEAEVSE